MQLVGPRFDDEVVISIAAALERVRLWADNHGPESFYEQ
jgi:Asp-tRNA(Asn)/Glu-tRNA(Gln) amidotransferase A subunit family amidase